MGCLGTVIILACIAGFVIVLVAYPKQTIGCGGALVVVAVIGIAALLENERKSSEQYRARQEAVTASVTYSPATCGEATPLSVTVHNGGTQTLEAIDLHLQAFRPGRSTNLLDSDYSGSSLKWDTILSPGQSQTLCYGLPYSIARSQADPPATLEWKFGYTYPRFR